ncbi:hypothetical protein [Moraxella marmotae]|uniref:hypothetical protein n=1 Tax=Moraxella marmotae TaxID=3344520 RepID=UPI0035F45822
MAKHSKYCTHISMAIVASCLMGCQHIQLAQHPLPITLANKEPILAHVDTDADTDDKHGNHGITHKPALPQKNRPIKPFAQPRTESNFFSIKDWF